MELTLKQKQDKAKRDQKILAAVMACLVLIFGYISNSMGFLVLALVYGAVVICVIVAELLDESRVRLIIQEYNRDYCKVQYDSEPEKIDVIS